MDVNQPTGTASQAEALALRYGSGAEPAPGPWNDVIATLLSHRSVRGFRPDALPDGTLETLVAAAQSASTSSNLQTWSVVAVTDPAKKAALAKIANNQKHIEQCPLFLVWLADVSRNERLGDEEGVTLETIPHLETYLVAAIDASLAAQNATVAAELLAWRWFTSAHCATIRSRWDGFWACRPARWAYSECVSAIHCRPSPTR